MMAKLLTVLRLRLRDAFTVDVRSLAMFRVAVGAVLLGSLIHRSQDLTAMYTNAGMLPDSLWWQLRETPAAWSIHLWAGSTASVALIFAVHAILALGILVGWRTRWCCLGAWLLLVSLHHRNPLLVTGGDVLLGMFLFWGMLLPLDAHWALSCREQGDQGRRTRHVSLASLGLLLQIVLMYFISGISKLNPVWLSGEALELVWDFDMLVLPAGKYLQQYHWLTLALTYGTLGLELVGPWLLLTTVWKARLRWAALLAFVGFHVGIAITMDVKVYSYVCFAGLLVFVPTSFWRAARIKPVCWTTVCADAGAIGTAGRYTRAGLASLGIILLLLYNGSYVRGNTPPTWLENVTSVVTWNQRWSMFAVPTRSNERHVMFAELANGEIVDVLRGGAAIPTESAASLSARLPSPLWTRLCVYLNFPANTPFREAAAQYRMRSWDAEHDQREQIRLLEYRIIDLTSVNEEHPAGKTLFSLQIDPFAEGNYVDGLPEGEWVFRHPNGNVSSQGTFVAGVKQGRWRSFYPDGSPESDGLFLNNQPHGAWRYWDEEGEVLPARYAYGKPIEADATSLSPK